MKIIRFTVGGRTHFGVLAGERIRVLRGTPFARIAFTGDAVPIASVRLLAPVVPPDVFAIGLNYRRHAQESGTAVPTAPVIFLKAASSVTDPGADIVLPAMAPAAVDYEAELAIVIGKTCHGVPEEQALDYVLGYTCGNDVSARDCQFQHDKQWARAKSFATFCPLGPWIETELDPNRLPISLTLNGTTMQDSTTADMIFSCRQLVSYCSRITALRPGTVIMTGTPSGVGFARQPPVFLRSGDVVEVSIGGIGVLRNQVQAEG